MVRIDVLAGIGTLAIGRLVPTVIPVMLDVASPVIVDDVTTEPACDVTEPRVSTGSPATEVTPASAVASVPLPSPWARIYRPPPPPYLASFFPDEVAQARTGSLA